MISFEDVVIKLSQYSLLLKNKLIIDCCSVKTFAKNILLKYLPNNCDILCTHPNFGPDSCSVNIYNWENLKFIYDKVRINNPLVCNIFINFFENKGCICIDMPSDIHDMYSSQSQFITHLIGRVLGDYGIKSTPINTIGYDNLLKIVNHTTNDSFELFKGLYNFNKNSNDNLEKLKISLDNIINLLTNNNNNIFNKNLNNIQISATNKIALNTNINKDLINLSIGTPDYPPPLFLKTHAIDYINNIKNSYTNIDGLFDLRFFIADYYRNDKFVDCSENNIIITLGAKFAIYQILTMFLNKHDEVIVISPYWCSYIQMIELLGGKIKILKTIQKNNYEIDYLSLQKLISNNTKALIINNPTNPTGKLFNKSELLQFSDFMNLNINKHIYIISDEIYDKIVFKEHFCLSYFNNIKKRVLIVNGFSKGYSMTGYRIGYILADNVFIEKLKIIQSNTISCVSHISQILAKKIMETHFYEKDIINNYINNNINYLLLNLKYITNIFDKNNIHYYLPSGTFYIWINIENFYNSDSGDPTNYIYNADDFCEFILKKHNILVISGKSFGDSNYIRMVFSIDFKKIVKVMKIFENIVKKNN
tara:strand:- start:1551 stop:3326 length:1776 start_codon:yes stop_codon:yes gene_type:complete